MLAPVVLLPLLLLLVVPPPVVTLLLRRRRRRKRRRKSPTRTWVSVCSTKCLRRPLLLSRTSTPSFPNFLISLFSSFVLDKPRTNSFRNQDIGIYASIYGLWDGAPFCFI